MSSSVHPSSSAPSKSGHYAKYAAMPKIDRVSLADYGPKGRRWYPWALLMVALTRYSAPRADFLFDSDHWRRHWVSLIPMWVLWILFIAVPLTLDCAPLGCISNEVAYVCMALGWILAYPVSWGILHKRIEFVSLFKSRAKALQAWEFVLWFGWYVQGIGYASLTIVPYDPRPFPQEFFDNPLVITIAVVLLILGSTMKMYCAYLSGLNNYYYYDMMMDRPNERFVDSGLYKYFSSPTYHIGYIDGYGLALFSGYLRRGSPMLLLAFGLLCHVTIAVVNNRIEAKFVNKMYLSNNAK